MELAVALTPGQCFNKWKETIPAIPDDQEELPPSGDEPPVEEPNHPGEIASPA